jgi:hypothetical protein
MQRFAMAIPIVKDGKVTDLLTRRDVDRAVSHDLNYTVEIIC